jgi:hypothetical protein
MRRWFLSYHSADLALAERLEAMLRRRDADSQVFFAPAGPERLQRIATTEGG